MQNKTTLAQVLCDILFFGLVKSAQRLVGQKLFHYQVDLKIQTYAKSIWSPVA